MCEAIAVRQMSEENWRVILCNNSVKEKKSLERERELELNGSSFTLL